MPRFVVLLRGVNVGKGNRVPMAEFRLMLEELGFSDVKTLLNSGNAVVSSSGRSGARHALIIAAKLEEAFGVSTAVIVKSSAELAAVVESNPLVVPDSEHSRFVVAFGPEESALRSLESVLPPAKEPERLVITSKAAYVYCPARLLESKVGAALLGKAGRGVTTRNWSTVLKLAALARAA